MTLNQQQNNSIVYHNENFKLFISLFSQNGIGDLLRQEIKILRKFHFIEKSTRVDKITFKQVINYNIPKMNLGDYEIYEEGEEEICNECYKILHYDKCLCCEVPLLKFPSGISYIELTKFDYRLLNFQDELINRKIDKFSKLSYEDKMEIFKNISKLQVEYCKRGGDICDNRYILDIRPCE